MMETHNCWWKERVFYEIYPRSFQDSNGCLLYTSFALFMRDAIVIFHKFADKTLGEIPIDTGKLRTYTKEKIVTGSNGEKYEANHS